MKQPFEASTGPLPSGEDGLWPLVARGDRRAAEQLAALTYAGVYASLFRFCGGDRELASDLTQETYRKAWTSLARFRGGSAFSTWLYRIAYNTFLNHVRRPRRVEAVEDPVLEAEPDPAPGPESNAGLAADGERLRRAVLALPDELRYAVTAHYWGERPVREIAAEQGITAVGVRKRLQRATARLALALEDPS